MDRGYECYNTIAHIEQMGMYYMIRGKDISSKGIAASLRSQLPESETFDVMTSFFLSKKNTKNVKNILNFIKESVQIKTLIFLRKILFIIL